MTSPLYDLDELVLQCRNERARNYIREAVSSYRAGAFRAAIVSTWIAVCFDIMQKFHELAIAGDAAAGKEAEALERIRANGDVTAAMRFEKDLLNKAKSPFELVNNLEYIDLTRLYDDRNRCAHPSFVADGEAYSPPGELARLHIRNAVTVLLMHPPAQGKYALDRLLTDVRSQLFPRKVDEAQAWLANGAMRRPRDSLTRNFVAVLIKDYLIGEADYPEKSRYSSALKAVRNLHHQQWNEAVRAHCSPVIRQLDDTKLGVVVEFFSICNEAWSLVEADVSQRVLSFIRELPSDKFDVIENALSFDAFAKEAKKRIARSTVDEIENVFWFDIPASVADRLIDIYLRSRSFSEANKTGRLLTVYASELSVEHAQRIIKGSAANEEIVGSFDFPGLLNALHKKTKGVRELGDFVTLLNDSGLGGFADDIPP
ncbi:MULTISPECIES: hypothetical protein [Stenotrophomonas maltophilia group]|uniref:hypothetical protein n=1 Tax=Stenotrophomonas maltophilia group TaxID=995085 RepID=UPI0015C54AD1|nr:MULTISPECIES: hypothetical protein [Stenotrophomonas maltophilia group]